MNQTKEPQLSIYDRYANITHIAIHWDSDIDCWALLSIGTSLLEIEDRVSFWQNKGTNDIKVFDVRIRP